LAPFLRALDNPMAMACLRLFTGLRALPLLSVPRFFRALPFRLHDLLLYRTWP
jgi:hypothetical protein